MVKGRAPLLRPPGPRRRNEPTVDGRSAGNVSIEATMIRVGGVTPIGATVSPAPAGASREATHQSHGHRGGPFTRILQKISRRHAHSHRDGLGSDMEAAPNGAATSASDPAPGSKGGGGPAVDEDFSKVRPAGAARNAPA